MTQIVLASQTPFGGYALGTFVLVLLCFGAGTTIATNWRGVPDRHPVLFFGRPLQAFLLRHRRGYGWFLIGSAAVAWAMAATFSLGRPFV